MLRLTLLPLALFTGAALADDTKPGDPPDTPSGLVVAQQTTQQRQAMLETKRTAQRLEAMLRVLAYHQLDAAAEKKIVQEASATLRGLSEKQMQEILKSFDTAAQSKTLAEMDKQLDQAHDKHRVVLDQVRQLLTRFELMRNLEQAAMRLDKLAFDQKQLREQVILAEQQRRMQVNQRRGMRPESPQSQALRQEDIARESDAVLQKLNELKNDLPEELKPRLDKVLNINMERNIKQGMLDAANHLRYRNQREAEDRQIQAQNDLERLARTLRTPADKLGILQEARDRVQLLKEQQQQLLTETVARKDPRDKDDQQKKPEEKELKAARQSAKQAEVMVQTRDVKDLLNEIAQAPAKLLEASTVEMKSSKEFLRVSQPNRSEQPQQQAIDKLTEAHKQLDQLVQEEEKAQRDPLNALKRAMEEIDAIIVKQKQLKAKTRELQETTKTDALKPLAPKQQHLAEQTEGVIAKPLAAKPETKLLIQTAAEAMHVASENLHGLQGESAHGQQQRAIDDLIKARKALEQDAKEIEERREQIAALEAAMKKVEELIAQQAGIEENSKKLNKDDKSDVNKKASNDLASKQNETKEQTKKLAEEVAKPSPEAKKPLTTATEKMQNTSEALKAQQQPQATEAAAEAKKKLEEAKQAISESLAQKQAEEAAAEAAQNPDKVSPAEAAVHVAKALMESKEASKQASQAAKDAAKDQSQAKQSMEKSEAASKSAQAAIDQAKAMSPQNVQSTLNQAREKLEQAKQNLQQQSPANAQKNQEQATKELTQALQSLQQTMAAMEKQQSEQQAKQDAQNQQQGKDGQKGQQQAKNQAKDSKSDKASEGDSKEKNQSADPNQNGERDGNAKSEKANTDGKSTFVNLPARQRDLIMQALGDKLPPEHAAQIQRYFESIAAGKAATESPKK